MQTIEDFYIRKDFFDEGKALAYLLDKGYLFSNSRPYIENPWDDKDKWEIGSSTIVLFVLCNDLFYWASGDAESITINELPDFLEHILKEKWGADKWTCKKRKLRPQQPIIERMKEDGVWDADMEALPEGTEEYYRGDYLV